MAELFGYQAEQYKNNSGEEIPACGVIRITDLTIPNAGSVFLTGEKPNTFGAQYSHFINVPVPVAVDEKGICYRAPIMVALYDDADGTPAQGELWGPRDDSWKLKKNTPGFRVVKVTNTTLHLVQVIPVPFLMLRGVADEAINADELGTVSIYYRSAEDEYTDTGVNVEVLNDLDVTIASGAMVRAVWESYIDGSDIVEGWAAYQAGCAPS